MSVQEGFVKKKSETKLTPDVLKKKKKIKV